jgi:hypothetical protein
MFSAADLAATAAWWRRLRAWLDAWGVRAVAVEAEEEEEVEVDLGGGLTSTTSQPQPSSSASSGQMSLHSQPPLPFVS